MASKERDGNAIPLDYNSWGDEASRQKAFASTGRGLARAEPVVRSKASFSIVQNGSSIREGFDRRDWEDSRVGEALPCRPKDAIRACMDIYETNGIVHNVMDLMSDFAVQGMDIVHQNERIERFYKEWWLRVGAVERSERFLNLLFRCGNVVVKRSVARLAPSDEERLRRASGSALVPASASSRTDFPPDLKPREIPWRYTFLNPLTLDLICERLAPFMGADSFTYALRVPEALSRLASSAISASTAEQAFLAKLPAEVKEILRRGEKTIALDPREVKAFHYKRDDWKGWAMPMTFPVLRDIMMLEKMKLADLAALDGAISCIRVWKLGSLDAKIMPSESVILRLAEMLNNNVGGGVMDLVWGPDIELLETSTEVHRFLGEAKYAPVINAVFQGLGVPPTLSGSSPPGGYTNNYLSLKTMTERLQYGRGILATFWAEEIRLVQRAMGFRHPAQVTFDRLLTDETAEKQLLLSMADRDLISVETIQERFGLTPEIEDVRIRREARKRSRGNLPKKASPFHDANSEDGMKKIFAQSGAYSPSEFGIELEPKKPGEESPQEAAPVPVVTAPKGEPGEGRPLNSKDKTKRKNKKVKPQRGKAALVAELEWADRALACVSKTASSAYLAAKGKKSLRELTGPEEQALESCKFSLLLSLPFGSDIGEEGVRAVASAPLVDNPVAARLLDAAVARHAEVHGAMPSLEVRRRFFSSICALVNGGDSGQDDGA